MALSPEANKIRKQHQDQFWLKRAKEYGILTEGREAEAITEARRIYTENYWERKAQGR
jgi:hypothetical protein